MYYKVRLKFSFSFSSRFGIGNRTMQLRVVFYKNNLQNGPQAELYLQIRNLHTDEQAGGMITIDDTGHYAGHSSTLIDYHAYDLSNPSLGAIDWYAHENDEIGIIGIYDAQSGGDNIIRGIGSSVITKRYMHLEGPQKYIVFSVSVTYSSTDSGNASGFRYNTTGITYSGMED